MNKKIRVIISGGGTGGHIFPAIAIANAIKSQRPEAEILFVGALGRMEMQRVPAAGYDIKGLPISGFDRKNLLRNVVVLYKIWRSQRLAAKIISTFRPMVAVGVGGYASGPTLNKCASCHIPYIIQEQNSYAGVTNKLLAKRATKICVAYEGMERFFPKDRILLTGNPVRQSLLGGSVGRDEAVRTFGLDPQKPVLLIVGGSLGARTLNESMKRGLETVRLAGVQVLWQSGKYYSEEVKAFLSEAAEALSDVKENHSESQESLSGTAAEQLSPSKKLDFIVQKDFFDDMNTAYAAADLVISRAGASSISELSLIGKPCILVPSPNVAEDHQTKNAMALVSKEAAICVKDSDAVSELMPLAISVVRDTDRLKTLSENIKKLGRGDAADVIAAEVIRIADASPTI